MCVLPGAQGLFGYPEELNEKHLTKYVCDLVKDVDASASDRWETKEVTWVLSDFTHYLFLSFYRVLLRIYFFGRGGGGGGWKPLIFRLYRLCVALLLRGLPGRCSDTGETPGGNPVLDYSFL